MKKNREIIQRVLMLGGRQEEKRQANEHHISISHFNTYRLDYFYYSLSLYSYCVRRMWSRRTIDPLEPDKPLGAILRASVPC